jgi:hypothetical protein
MVLAEPVSRSRASLTPSIVLLEMADLLQMSEVRKSLALWMLSRNAALAYIERSDSQGVASLAGLKVEIATRIALCASCHLILAALQLDIPSVFLGELICP